MNHFFSSLYTRVSTWNKRYGNLKGDGNLYVLFVIASVMAGAFALTGGILPTLEADPPASKQVEVDEASVRRSSENALQLVDLKIKPSPTPTPTPLPIATSTPVPPVACLNKIALNLILDVSASMNNQDKINQLNLAMKGLVGQLKDDTVVGAVTFAGPTSFPNTTGNLTGTITQLPFTRYRDNKALVINRLTTLTAYSGSETDGTYMRNAFQRSLNNLDAAQASYESQGYTFATIIFTDGVPETKFWDDDCVVQVNGSLPVCFARKQDPRISPSLTSSMKSRIGKVYSVGIYSGQRETQTVIYNEATRLLGEIASQATYARNSNNPTAINSVFADVLSSVCQ